ncbi:MAG: GHKL domain-containing protein [Candidatus Aureabacteria bacterium]|jgi:light-regulated signal transduction histidine kinase (bacteriophytochrome)|nr:GHKL domain-containing protein [Candidatus Auribacterota bacterium]HOE27080.1 ATP-binding protein [bacterium]HQM51614.1 ATP-binding protein [bacterium]
MVEERTAQLAESNQRLEMVNRELEAFSYSASHDLRAPLRSMEGFAQALLEDYGDRMEEKARDYLGRIINASRTMAELIDDLLSLSRVTRSEMRIEKTDLSAIAETILATHARTEPARAVEYVVEPGAVARCDPRLLRIALENLLDNAWKFTGKTPNARIEFRVVRENGVTMFCVQDNGAGFEMEYAGKLFAPFQRLHAAGDFPGTGIGLAIVQRIVHRHGGTVRAEGKPGGGATICFTL